jgi:hypothetical protein
MSTTSSLSSALAFPTSLDNFNHALLRSTDVEQATLTTALIKNYDPFDSSYIDFLPFLPATLIILYIILYTSSPALRWAPKPVLTLIHIFSPFISENDLKSERGLHQSTFLRRGAVLREDEDPKQYSQEGFAKQSYRNALICFLSLLEIVAWTLRSGWSISYGDFSWDLQSDGLMSTATSLTWVSF